MNCAWLMNTQESGLFSASTTMETGAATPPTCELSTKSLTSFTTSLPAKLKSIVGSEESQPAFHINPLRSRT